MIKEVLSDPFIPFATRYTKGMVANDSLTGWRLAGFNALHHFSAWFNSTIAYAQHKFFDVNKGVANRYLSPFLPSYQIVTFYIHKEEKGGFHNFLHLRNDTAAEPHIRAVAESLQEIYNNINSYALPPYKGWHIPMVNLFDDEDVYPSVLSKLLISAGRCAMVSYYPPGSTTPNPMKDIDRAWRMIGDSKLHASPFEHQVFYDKDLQSVAEQPLPQLGLQFRHIIEYFRYERSMIRFSEEEMIRVLNQYEKDYV
jgi:hypothetical protein